MSTTHFYHNGDKIYSPAHLPPPTLSSEASVVSPSVDHDKGATCYSGLDFLAITLFSVLSEECFYEPYIISRLAGEVISEGLAGCPKGMQVSSWSLVLTPEFMQTVEKCFLFFFFFKSSLSYNSIHLAAEGYYSRKARIL